MPTTQRSVLPVTAGMNPDAAPGRMPSGSYRDAVGFRSRVPGHVGRLTLIPSQEAHADLPYGYDSVAQAVVDNDTIFLLRRKDGGSGRIYHLNGNGDMVKLFDDANDEAGEKLNFPDIPFLISVSREVDDRVDLYWTDGVNVPRVLRLGETVTSVHALGQQPSVDFGHALYAESGSGTCLQGFYKYSYRYRDTHRVTVPFRISVPLQLSAAAPFIEMPTAMGGSGIVTTLGFAVLVDRIDNRWPTIELLVAYSPDNNTYTDLVVVASEATAGAASKTLWCRSVSGVGQSVPIASLSEYYQPIDSSEVMSLHNNKLIHGDVKVGVSENPIVIPPKIGVLREYRPVEDPSLPTKESLAANIDVARRSPLFGNNPLTTTIYDQQYVGKNGPVTLPRPVKEQRLDYSGTQFAHSRVDYRAGEVYPLGLLVHDRMGQHTFVYDLGMFAPTPLYQAVYPGNNQAVEVPTALTRVNSNGTTDIVHIGAIINELYLDDAMLRDKSGKLNVSGFSIVRGPSTGRMGPQGLLLNAVVEDGGRTGTVVPLPTWKNYFNNNPIPQLLNEAAKGPDSPTDIDNEYLMDGRLMTFHSPDLMVNAALLDSQPKNSKITPLSVVLPVKQSTQGVDVQQQGWHQYIIKAYRNTNSFQRTDVSNRAALGTGVPILGNKPLPRGGETDVEGTDARRADIKFAGASYPVIVHPINPAGILLGKAWVGAGNILTVEQRLMVDAGASPANPAGYVIASVENAVDTVPGSKIRYQTTGHYQPITEADLANVPTVIYQGKKCYVFDGIHVWGGDTYRQRVGIALQVPMYDPDAFDPDYGLAVMTVLENHYNQQLRTGRRWETVGFESQKTAFKDEAEWMRGGVAINQPENWDLNRGLTMDETVMTYGQRPPDARLGSEWNAGVVHSATKTDTEQYDSLLKYPATNFYLLDGELGSVTGLHSTPMGFYAVQQLGVAALAVNERSVVQTDAGAGLLIASGREVGPHEYRTRESGAAYRQHTWNGDGSFYWIDGRTGDLMRFTQAGRDNLSIRTGISHYGGVFRDARTQGLYNAIRKEVTIGTVTHRVIYDEVLDNAPSRRTALQPTWILPVPGGLSELIDNRVFRVGLFYPCVAAIAFEDCPMPGHQMRWRSGMLTCDELLASVVSQITLITRNATHVIAGNDSRIQYRHGRLCFPLRSETADESLQGDWIKVQFSFALTQPLPASYISQLELDYIPATRQ